MVRSLLLAGVFGAAAGSSTVWFEGDNGTQITFVSVGQGDCSVLRTGGRTIVVDVGPASPTFDAGRSIVVPELRAMGVRSVDLILLTHPDADHVDGLPAVMEAYPEAKVVVSAGYRTAPKMLAILSKSHMRPENVDWVSGMWRGRIGRFSMVIDCPPVTPEENDNDGCLFVKFESGHASAVLTGDAPAFVEDEMTGDASWSAEILKVGHHGSRTSCGDSWLATVKPEYAVVSCGLNNRYGHPNKETEGRIRSEGAEELRTDLQGDIEFDFDGDRFRLVRPTPLTGKKP